MDCDQARLLRLRRSEALDLDSRPLTRLAAAANQPAPRGTPRFLGQVTTGGSIPDQTGMVFVVNPVRLDGPESEGATPGTVVDPSRTIPVVVIGETAPSVGDLLMAVAVGGRWVATAGASSCFPCRIPTKDLTVSWSNTQFGAGSTKLIYTPPGEWNSACSHQILYSLSCAGGQIQLVATHFPNAYCQGSQGVSCISPGVNPYALTLTSYTCVPFFLRYSVTSRSCPVISGAGFTSFTITE
jgi:hypothetical protein